MSESSVRLEHEVKCMLTERERWLIEKAYEAGADSILDAAGELFETHKYRFKPCQHWLEDVVADGGVTVELALCKDAPNAALTGERTEER